MELHTTFQRLLCGIVHSNEAGAPVPPVFGMLRFQDTSSSRGNAFIVEIVDIRTAYARKSIDSESGPFLDRTLEECGY